MRRLIVVIAVVFTLMVSPCFAIQFCKDVLEPGNPGGVNSHKTWDDELALGGAGDVTIDIWINDVPEPLLTAGAFLEYDPSKLRVLDADFMDGWDPGMSKTVQTPTGPGSYMLTTGNFSYVSPDGDGDIGIATIQFECLDGSCDGEIMVKPVPNYDTFVGKRNSVYDSNISPNYLSIVPNATSSTTTTTDYICVPETIYGEHSTETELLRSLRDNVLSKTQEGQELIKLYYLWSPVIVRAMEADEEFKQEVKDIVDDMLPLISH